MWSCFKFQNDDRLELYRIADARLRCEQRIAQLEKKTEKDRQYLNHLGGKLSRYESATPLEKETETMLTFLNSKPCYKHLLEEYKRMSRGILRKAFDIDMSNGEPKCPSKERERGESCHAALNFSPSVTSTPLQKKFHRLEPRFAE